MCMKILRPTQNCKKKNIEKKPLQREKSNTGIYIKKGTKIGELPCRIIFLLYLTKNFLSQVVNLGLENYRGFYKTA